MVTYDCLFKKCLQIALLCGRMLKDRARWGAGGALCPQSATAGLKACLGGCIERLRIHENVDIKVLCNGDL